MRIGHSSVALPEQEVELIRVGLKDEQVQKLGGFLGIGFHGVRQGGQDFGGVREMHEEDPSSRWGRGKMGEGI